MMTCNAESHKARNPSFRKGDRSGASAAPDPDEIRRILSRLDRDRREIRSLLERIHGRDALDFE